MLLKTPDRRWLILALQFFLKIKMAQQKINMPSGSGGLVRYFDEYKSKIRIKAGHIIIMCIIVSQVYLFYLKNYTKIISMEVEILITNKCCLIGSKCFYWIYKCKEKMLGYRLKRYQNFHGVYLLRK